jgi:hypothetical protein
MGQVIERIFAREISLDNRNDLVELIKNINAEVQQFHIKHGRDITDPGVLGGLKSGIVKISDEYVKGISWVILLLQ